MDDNPERRDRTRFPHETLLTLENEEIGQLHGVRMYNFSRSGVYFETNFYLQPGTDLFVGIQSSPFAEKSDVYECYRAVIKWRKFLEESSYDYGYGIELIEKAPQGSLKPENAESRKHERKKCSIPAVISTPSETSDVLINNISKSGIFFKTHQRLSPGQGLDLMIPMRNKGKLLKRRGTVVWSKGDGVGVEFEQSPVADEKD